MPITPLFHVNFIYVKKDNVHGVHVSEMGYLDFKYAFIDDAGIDELL
jgi:MarR-like DNA-binding transcriptional regulator SgrR of sgrS sRNA